jgi:hypothetical protein
MQLVLRPGGQPTVQCPVPTPVGETTQPLEDERRLSVLQVGDQSVRQQV